jgi:crotonobetainyl-CoA:carnitine CoA-transferase CaiB-like acyl-CoA transferase
MRLMVVRGSLEGILVADFSRALAGPLATMLLGDLGADVIKVERKGVGDESRAWGPFVDGDSSYFLSVNRNKRSLELDLADEGDRLAAQELARRADVVVENFRPGVMDAFGIGYDAVVRTNPGVIYCSISAFGTGSGAQNTGYDFLLQAVGGLMSVTGTEAGGPTKVGVPVVDIVSGLYATIGILSALREREVTGLGQRVATNLLSSLLAILTNQSSALLTTGSVPQRAGNAHPGLAPYELFPTAGGDIALAVGNDRQFTELCLELGRPDLSADARFQDNAARTEHRPALRDELIQALAGDTADHWIARLEPRRVPCGRVNDIAEAIALAERLGLEPTFTVPRERGHPIPQISNPLRLSRTPVTYRSAPPRLGEHSASLLEWLGQDRLSPSTST